MTTLRALRNGIVFQFEEAIKGSGKDHGFNETSQGGIYLGSSFDATAKQSRWGIVTSVGDEVMDEGIVPGARVFIEALKWTNGFEVDGQKYWKTDEECILLVDDGA